MKRKKSFPAVCLFGFLVMAAAAQAQLKTTEDEKQWHVFHRQIPEGCTRYDVDLGYLRSSSRLYNKSCGDLRSISLSADERIEGYEERLDLGAAPDGYRYWAMLGDAREFKLLSRDGRGIHRIRILRAKDGSDSQIVDEGYFFIGRQVEIAWQVSTQRLGLGIDEILPGTLSMNIYKDDSYSYRGSCRFGVEGSLTGSALIEVADLGVFLSYRDSLRPGDIYVELALRPFNRELSRASASGEITGVFALHSAKIVVEKLAKDYSMLTLAVLEGELMQRPSEQTDLVLNEPAPSFVRVDIIRRQLVTLEELYGKKGGNGYVVLIFGDLNRAERDDRGYELDLDETVITSMLSRNMDGRPAIVFVSRRFFLPDLYGRWLGQNPGFYVVLDYSNPMDIQFYFSGRCDHGYRRPSEISKTLRREYGLADDNVSVVVVNSEGNVAYVDADAGRHLAETMAAIRRLMKPKEPEPEGD